VLKLLGLSIFRNGHSHKTYITDQRGLSMAFYHEFRGRTLFARHENRLFYPVVFCSGPRVTPAGECYFTVYFNDGWCKNVTASEVIGPQLSSLDTRIRLYLGQRVCTYYMGEEQRGSVVDHVGDAVRVRLDQFTELMCFNINQLSLSADTARPHFGSLDSFQDFAKQRPEVLDVNLCHWRNQTDSPFYEEQRAPEDTQDIRKAALALTSLSLASPVTGRNEGTQKEQFSFPPKVEKDEEMEPSALQIDEGYSESVLKPRTRSFETPKALVLRKTRTGSLDLNIGELPRERKFERAESWDVEKYSPENKSQKLEKMNKAFKCMWRGCGKVLTSLPGIVRHVKMAHLGPTTEENVEFYFNDLFIDNDTSFSSEDSLLSSGISDDETLAQSEALQGEEGIQMLNSADSNFTNPVLQEEITKVEEEKDSQSLKQEKYTRSRIPKSKGRIRASREKSGYGGIEAARKCRKVYGMDNRNLWCTQCRWKKACVRFGK